MITWESLDFQPYFTATASNAGYGWWSHDIGGHFKGYRDDELATRWVQLGVFSPVNRLHSGLNPFNTKEPWRFAAAAEKVMTEFLRLRHQLLPYLATMNLRAHADGEPLVQPMYYDHPDEPAAYDVPNQFMFGSELLVAPITSPRRPARPGSAGSGVAARGHLDRRVHRADATPAAARVYLHRDLTSIPVLARAGAIVPMVPAEQLPRGTDLRLRGRGAGLPGADGAFTLAEDRDDERWARTRITYDDASGELTVHDVEGDAETLRRPQLPGRGGAALRRRARPGVRAARDPIAGVGAGSCCPYSAETSSSAATSFRDQAPIAIPRAVSESGQTPRSHLPPLHRQGLGIAHHADVA